MKEFGRTHLKRVAYVNFERHPELGALFEGALTEQYVQQELRATLEVEPFTWAPSDSSAEIDFIVESSRGIVPIEAKAERNLQAKSLGVYRAKFAPPFAVRTSLADPHEADGLWDIPLCALGPICNRLFLSHR